MKYKIYKEVLKNKIKSYIPPRYFCKLPVSWPEKITIIVFKTDRNNVVLSNTVEAALSNEDLNNQINIVVFGGCFTIESIQLLRDRDISYISISDFLWTDESYKQILMNS
ncbi:hypothetical protein [Paenibacillus sp. Leaf72]|uniref:hypothetical protein n=1 Tax=Paenibacillus sp. Leaf72 TaxID=1736234 RepID=UPI000700CEA4|nr:hypothetical protein [Paenibacillus sp. Leaf72]KQN98976.1 hypothetical protein ASF12_19520 [Paenibacillus sp. Leaf72]